MGRCSCDSGSCQCVVQGGDNVTVTGTGSVDTPYVVAAPHSPVIDRLAVKQAGTPVVPPDPYGDHPTPLIIFDALSDAGTAIHIDSGDNTVIRTDVAGPYAVTAAYSFTVAIGNRGPLFMAVVIDVDGRRAIAWQSNEMLSDGQQIGLSASLTWWSPANGKIQFFVNNYGSVDQPIDTLFARIQRL